MSHHERRIAALAAIAGLLFPRSADATTSAGAGVLAGVSLFHNRPSFALTVQAYVTEGWDRRTMFEPGCRTSPAYAVGPMGAVSFAKGGPRFIAAAIGGGDVTGSREFGATSAMVGGEVGAVWGAAGDPGVGLHLGATASTSVLAAAARVEEFREVSVSGGLWYVPPFGGVQQYCVIVGRPRRDDEGRRIDAEAGTGWAQEAQQEADSVIAFLDLAQALLEADATDGLVGAALDSAEDEIHHALLCAREAGVMPTLSAFGPRSPLRGREALDRLATESFHDGWINEGVAALDALARSRSARGTARRALGIIARDEARHAQLGRAITTWAIDRGGRIER